MDGTSLDRINLRHSWPNDSARLLALMRAWQTVGEKERI